MVGGWGGLPNNLRLTYEQVKKKKEICECLRKINMFSLWIKYILLKVKWHTVKFGDLYSEFVLCITQLVDMFSCFKFKLTSFWYIFQKTRHHISYPMSFDLSLESLDICTGKQNKMLNKKIIYFSSTGG